MKLGITCYPTYGGLPEAVQNGVDGFLAAPRDVAAAANRAIEILSREERAVFHSLARGDRR